MSTQILVGDCLDVLRGLPRPAALAYCAGVIDSDGTIGVKKNTYAMRRVRDCEQPTYIARVCVRQVEVEALQVLQALFGGSISQARSYATKGRALYQWEARDMRAEAALKALLPYLRIKRKQAQNGLALRELIGRSKKARVAKGRGHAGAARRPKEITDAMERLYLEAKRLNRVGIEGAARDLPN